MNRRVLPLVAGLAALVLAACGGGGELKKPELVSQADKICKDTSKELGKIPTPTKPADLADYGNKASDVIGAGTKKLKGMNPEQSLQKDYDTFTNAAERQKELASDLAGVAKSGDRAQIQAVLTKAQKADAEGKAAASRLGFKDCGKAGPPSPGRNGPPTPARSSRPRWAPGGAPRTRTSSTGRPAPASVRSLVRWRARPAPPGRARPRAGARGGG